MSTSFLVRKSLQESKEVFNCLYSSPPNAPPCSHTGFFAVTLSVGKDGGHLEPSTLMECPLVHPVWKTVAVTEVESVSAPLLSNSTPRGAPERGECVCPPKTHEVRAASFTEAPDCRRPRCPPTMGRTSELRYIHTMNTVW